MSYSLVGRILREVQLERAQKWVLIALAYHANDAGENAFPSVATLARETGLSVRTVHTHLRELERRGYISGLREKSRLTTVYRIHADKLPLGKQAGAAAAQEVQSSPSACAAAASAHAAAAAGYANAAPNQSLTVRNEKTTEEIENEQWAAVKARYHLTRRQAIPAYLRQYLTSEELEKARELNLLRDAWWH
jgi:DNA-binding transcriptional MocR family regulator